jgi:hypothetical protein
MELLLVVIIIGIIAWAILRLPIAEPFRTIAIAVACVIIVIYLFRVLRGVI